MMLGFLNLFFTTPFSFRNGIGCTGFYILEKLTYSWNCVFPKENKSYCRHSNLNGLNLNLENHSEIYAGSIFIIPELLKYYCHELRKGRSFSRFHLRCIVFYCVPTWSLLAISVYLEFIFMLKDNLNNSTLKLKGYGCKGFCLEYKNRMISYCGLQDIMK